MTVVREDKISLFVVAGGYVARPGPLPGYDHAHRMDSAKLRKGDKVKARHIPGSELTKVTLDDGTVLHWGHDSLHEQDYRNMMNLATRGAKELDRILEFGENLTIVMK
jgi:hypothetical protein